MKPNTKDYSVLIRLVVIALLTLCIGAFAGAWVVASEVIVGGVEEPWMEHDNAVLETSTTRKGTDIIRIRNKTKLFLFCVIVSEPDYYYSSAKLRPRSTSKWLIRPEAEEFVWWCEE